MLSHISYLMTSALEHCSASWVLRRPYLSAQHKSGCLRPVQDTRHETRGCVEWTATATATTSTSTSISRAQCAVFCPQQQSAAAAPWRLKYWSLHVSGLRLRARLEVSLPVAEYTPRQRTDDRHNGHFKRHFGAGSPGACLTEVAFSWPSRAVAPTHVPSRETPI